MNTPYERADRVHGKTGRPDKKTHDPYKKSDSTWIEIVERGACELGLTLNPMQLDSMYFHGSELIKWNKKFNITSITDPFGIAVKHFIDCLALVPYLPDNSHEANLDSGTDPLRKSNFLANNGKSLPVSGVCHINTKVLDLGSGGGFPGIPLKIANPSLDITMMDASRKKISFINYIIRSLGMTGINAVHARCENFAEKKNFKHNFDFVVSRAFTSLDRFIDLSLPFLSKKGIILAMKGAEPEKEIQSVTTKQLCEERQLCLKVHNYILPMGKYNRSVIKIRQSE